MGSDIEWTIGVSAWRRAAAGQFTNLFVFYVALDTSFKHFSDEVLIGKHR